MSTPDKLSRYESLYEVEFLPECMTFKMCYDCMTDATKGNGRHSWMVGDRIPGYRCEVCVIKEYA